MCAPLAAIAETLDARYGERAVAAGVDGKGRRLILYATGNGATWTIVVVRGGGAACVVFEGVDWQNVDVPKAPQRPLFHSKEVDVR